jgi:hypothetical protein
MLPPPDARARVVSRPIACPAVAFGLVPAVPSGMRSRGALAVKLTATSGTSVLASQSVTFNEAKKKPPKTKR